ncbi:MAG: hypothetical protein J0H83_02390 [Candidatus Melainabacteria bacterium]|nr:hypothetical protein [Candidatus Melainabacteria bacterium]
MTDGQDIANYTDSSEAGDKCSLGQGSTRHVWMAIVFGLLVATANNWLLHPNHVPSNYSAPWTYQ